jgi:proline iminopeptidase
MNIATELLTVDRVGDTDVKIHLEQHGNPNGIPVIYLHGGPGDSIHPHVRHLFNPKVYHILLFDQRGCGKSTPRNLLEKNTTAHLIQDMEFIRNHVGVEKMVVAGGSWGSSLALLYAEAHPERVIGLILRGLFDLSLEENALEYMYPEQTTELETILKTKSKSRKYYEAVNDLLRNKTRRRDRQRVIDILSDNTPLAVIDPMPVKTSNADKYTMTVIGNHYERHHFFAKPKQIYTDLHKIKHLPIYMVQGRYDMVTPAIMAWRLYQKLDHCRLVMARGGHTHWEKAITKELCNASDDMARHVRNGKNLKKIFIDTTWK